MALGLLKLSDEQPPADIRMARHFIDIIALLQEKTKGNLVWDEERLLNNVLTELRFRYMQAFEDEKKKSAATPTPVPDGGV